MSLKLRQWLRLLRPAEAEALVRRRIRKIRRRLDRVEQRVYSFEPPAGVEVKGDVLFAYISDAFALKTGPEPVDPAKIPHGHTNLWESLQMVQTFLDLGYRVDAIDWRNLDFRPEKPYRVAVDVRILLEHWAPLLPDDCIKILHAETAHWKIHNPAQQKRLADLAERRGRAVAPHKLIEENGALEAADCITLIGENAEFITSSYAVAGKPIYQIPISAPYTYRRLDRDFEKVRKSFLWFGSSGLVHKGLDLVLEAFAAMPDYHLTICGPVAHERDFEREYWKELHRTPNIRLHGWVDVAEESFLELLSRHVGAVLPSCSEAQNGGVVTCMHAGLIPVVSHETGIPTAPDWGITLENSEVETIERTVRELASRAPATLASMSDRAREYAREHHTRERFAEVHRNTVEKILDRFGAPR